MIRTSAPDVDEVQTIATFANPGETLSGTFTVVVDLTASGGSIETSAQIPFDAVAMQDTKATRFDPLSPKPDLPMHSSACPQICRSSLQEILEAMGNVGKVEVNRQPFGVEKDIESGYIWTVTFKENEGDVVQMRLGTSNLIGTGAGVEFKTVTQGNEIGGAFALSIAGATTKALKFDSTSEEVTVAIESIYGVDTIDVTRSGPDFQRLCTFRLILMIRS